MITVLIENTSDSKLKCEHGLSLLIEYEGKRYLLDFGSSGTFLENAEEMGIHLEGTEICVLSHGHYDHAGGMGAYLEKNPGARVYAMRSVVEHFYSNTRGWMHEISIPEPVLYFRERFQLIDTVTKIGEGVWLIPHRTPGLAKIGERAGLFHRKDGKLQPDDFAHELSLVFETERGAAVFNSCSHAGICNILDEVEAALPGQKIYMFVGGLHMKGKKDGEEICIFSEEEVRQMAEYITDKGVQYLYTGHCTGEPGVKLLRQYLGDRVQVMHTGMVIGRCD